MEIDAEQKDRGVLRPEQGPRRCTRVDQKPFSTFEIGSFLPGVCCEIEASITSWGFFFCLFF